MAKLEEFQTLNEVELAAVEGGKFDWGRAGMCLLSAGIGAFDGYGMTAGATIFMGPYAIATGAVGAVVGGATGLATC